MTVNEASRVLDRTDVTQEEKRSTKEKMDAFGGPEIFNDKWPAGTSAEAMKSAADLLRRLQSYEPPKPEVTWLNRTWTPRKQMRFVTLAWIAAHSWSPHKEFRFLIPGEGRGWWWWWGGGVGAGGGWMPPTLSARS